MTPGQQSRRETTEEMQRQQQADEEIVHLEQEIGRLHERICTLKDALWYIRSQMDSGGDTDAFWADKHLRRLVTETVSGVLSRDKDTLSEIYERLEYPTMSRDTLDGGGDGSEPEDIMGIVGYSNGEYHLTNAEMQPMCSTADVTVQQWRWAKMYDPGRLDHDHDEVRNRLTCEECKAMQSSALDGGGGDS
jgi:hypothetical protein